MWWCCFLILQTRNFANICNSSLIWTYSGMTELPIYTVAATFTWCRPKRALSMNLLKHQMIENLWVCMHLVQLQIHKLSTTTNSVCVSWRKCSHWIVHSKPRISAFCLSVCVLFTKSPQNLCSRKQSAWNCVNQHCRWNILRICHLLFAIWLGVKLKPKMLTMPLLLLWL